MENTYLEPVELTPIIDQRNLDSMRKQVEGEILENYHLRNKSDPRLKRVSSDMTSIRDRTDLISVYLNNFFTKLPGGYSRKDLVDAGLADQKFGDRKFKDDYQHSSFYMDQTSRQFWKNIDAALAGELEVQGLSIDDFALIRQKADEIPPVNNQSDLDYLINEHPKDILKYQELLLSTMIRLRVMGYSTDELVS